MPLTQLDELKEKMQTNKREFEEALNKNVSEKVMQALWESVLSLSGANNSNSDIFYEACVPLIKKCAPNNSMQREIYLQIGQTNDERLMMAFNKFLIQDGQIYGGLVSNIKLETIEKIYGNKKLYAKLENFRKAVVELHTLKKIGLDNLIKKMAELYFVLEADIAKLPPGREFLNIDETAYPEILDYYEKVAKAFATVQTPAQIAKVAFKLRQDYSELEAKLTKNPFLSPLARNALLGVSVAILGTLVSLGGFAALTALSGGVAAIPLALLITVTSAELIVRALLAATLTSGLIGVGLMLAGVKSGGEANRVSASKTQFFKAEKENFAEVQRDIDQLSTPNYQYNI